MIKLFKHKHFKSVLILSLIVLVVSFVFICFKNHNKLNHQSEELSRKLSSQLLVHPKEQCINDLVEMMKPPSDFPFTRNNVFRVPPFNAKQTCATIFRDSNQPQCVLNMIKKSYSSKRLKSFINICKETRYNKPLQECMGVLVPIFPFREGIPLCYKVFEKLKNPNCVLDIVKKDRKHRKSDRLAVETFIKTCKEMESNKDVEKCMDKYITKFDNPRVTASLCYESVKGFTSSKCVLDKVTEKDSYLEGAKLLKLFYSCKKERN